MNIIVNKPNLESINSSIINEKSNIFISDWLSANLNGVVSMPKNDPNMNLDDCFFYVLERYSRGNQKEYKQDGDTSYTLIETANEIQVRDNVTISPYWKYRIVLIWNK